MLDEEVIVKDAKNGSERMLILNVILMVLVPAVLFGGNTDLATGLFVALGILAPLNVINYKRIWIDAPNGTIPFYFLSLLPFPALPKRPKIAIITTRIKSIPKTIATPENVVIADNSPFVILEASIAS